VDVQLEESSLLKHYSKFKMMTTYAGMTYSITGLGMG